MPANDEGNEEEQASVTWLSSRGDAAPQDADFAAHVVTFVKYLRCEPTKRAENERSRGPRPVGITCDGA